MFLVLRFLVASLIFLISSKAARKGARILFMPRGKEERRFQWDMIALGAALGGAYLSQTVGLLTTTTSKSAFLTSTAIIWTPIIAMFLGRDRLTLKLTFAVLIIIVGVFLMTQPFREGGIVVGDVLTLGCAVACSFYIILTERAMPRALKFASDEHEASLMVTSSLIIACGILFLIFLPLIETPRLHITTSSVGALLYTGIFTTCLTAYLQTRYQPQISATVAAIIYMLEPVVVMIIAAVFLSERIGFPELLGGGLIILGVIIAQLKFEPRWRATQQSALETSDY